MPEFTTLISGLSFTECPRWRDGRLYFSDFYTHRVLAVAMDGTAETRGLRTAATLGARVPARRPDVDRVHARPQGPAA